MIVAINKILAKPERNFSKACDLAMPVRLGGDGHLSNQTGAHQVEPPSPLIS